MKTPSFPAIPAPPEALAQAATHLHDGRLNQAEAILQALLAAHPADPAVHHLLGRHAAQAGDFTSAIARLTEACRLAPGSAQMPLELGRVRAAMGAFDAAQRHFEQAVALDPTLFDAWFLLGIIHMRNGHHEQALHPLRQAHRLQPDRADALHALADAQFHAGSPKNALPLWQAIVDAQPGNLDARLRLGETCSRLGLHADAVAGYRSALQVFPDSPDLWMAIAQAEEDDGNKQAAQDAYRHTTTLKPGWALPLSGLLGIQRAKASPELIAQATTLQQRADLPDPERALLGYALGKTNDGLGQYVAAMASWHDANAARRRMIGPHDRALLERQAQQMMAVFDADFFIRRGIHGNPDPRPVFVVGMPRSGTTLTEQIIAAHTQAFGCGELPDIPLIVKQLGDRWPGSASALDDDVLQQQAQHYLDAASRHAPADALRLVDKAPLNYFNLGLIALLFPQARVVWCRREPRDIALSIYSENFSLDSQFATDLGDIGHFIQVQAQLMRHWQAVLPLPILELQYESLVESPELQARRLIDFVGLPWQPTCLEFHRSERGVQTPSRWQVREPIHGRSAGRWRNYAADLAAFEAIFTNS
ncbi:MAG: sulfotransferase [Luteimonas sp.]